MNAITNALKDIKFAIPQEVLNVAFLEYGNVNINKIVSMDERIMSAVIRPIVLVDCNLIGGIDIYVDLSKCSISHSPEFGFLITVDKKLTAGRSILTAYEIICNVISTPTFQSYGTSPMISSGNKIYNNLSDAYIIQSSKLEMVGENTVLVYDPSLNFINGNMRCRIENAPNMGNLPPASYKKFSHLCTLAVKAYIYNYCVVRLDKGYAYQGHELGIIKDIIDQYNEAHQQYMEYLDEIMRKVLFLSQTDTRTRYINSFFGNNT